MVGNEDPQKNLLKLVLIHLNRLDDLHKENVIKLPKIKFILKIIYHICNLITYFHIWMFKNNVTIPRNISSLKAS